MPLNESKLHQSNGHTPPLKRPNQPAETTAAPRGQERNVPQVRSDGALNTANSVSDRMQQLQDYAANFHAVVGQQVDDAAFSIAATLATVPAQLANRTLFYLEKMGGDAAWSQFDRALADMPRSTGEQLLFNSNVFELPEGDVFEE